MANGANGTQENILFSGMFSMLFHVFAAIVSFKPSIMETFDWLLKLFSQLNGGS